MILLRMKPACLLFQICIGFATALLRQELEPYAPPPDGWARVGSPHPSSELELTLALRQSNIDELETRLLQVSDPDHPNYGKHMTHDEVSALVAPHPRAVSTVRRWLLKHGARIHRDRSSPNGEFVVAMLKLGAAERMLHTRYHHFEHAQDSTRHVLRASRSYSVPAFIAPLLDFVSPGHSFSMLSPLIQTYGGHGSARGDMPHVFSSAAGARKPKRRLRGDLEGGDKQEAGDEGDGEGSDEGDGDDDGDDQPDNGQPGRHNSWGASWGMPSKTRSGWPVWALGANTVSPDVVRSWFKLGSTHSKAAQTVSSRDAFKCIGLSGSAGATADSWMMKRDAEPTTGVVFGQAIVNFLRERTDLTHDLNKYFSATLPILCRWNRLASVDVKHGPGGQLKWAGSMRQHEWDLPAVRRMKSSGLAGVSVVTDSSMSDSALGPEAKRPTGEATMDVELILNTGAGVHTLVWGTAGHSPDPFTTQSNGEANEPWVKFMRQLAAAKCVPAVLSISYADNENSCTKPWARRGNIEFMKAGVRGVSIFVASGDGGVGGAWQEPCKGRLLATWPAGSPYVTAVGATMRQVDVSPESVQAQKKSVPGGAYKSGKTTAKKICTAGYTFFQAKVGSSRGQPLCIKEAEWASTQSAGGFSYYFKRPAYQKTHVARYLHKMRKLSKLPVTRKYNWMYGRAYPDVSAFGEDLLCNMHGRLQRGDGTSASTPLVAGVFAQLNDVRKRQGRPPLGFVNPFIYKNPQAFRDVVAGTNPGCGTGGFSAAPGWDAVTGMGSPNFEELAKAVKKLPN